MDMRCGTETIPTPGASRDAMLRSISAWSTVERILRRFASPNRGTNGEVAMGGRQRGPRVVPIFSTDTLGCVDKKRSLLAPNQIGVWDIYPTLGECAEDFLHGKMMAGKF